MSIFFNNNIGLKNNIENMPTDSKPVVAGKLANVPEYISALKEGSVFKGEILDVRNNAVKILLASNDVLNAKTDGSVQLNIGDILNFKVESNSGLSMLVKAVSNGNANGGLNMLMSALQSAEVPVNERNLALVRELVNNGQAIDKNTIKTLVSNLNSFTELDVDTAVTMFKHDIPINAENVTQFNNYVNANNKLMDSFNNMADDMVKVLTDYAKANPKEDVTKLANEMLKAITGDDQMEVSKLVNSEVTPNTAEMPAAVIENTTTNNANANALANENPNNQTLVANNSEYAQSEETAEKHIISDNTAEMRETKVVLKGAEESFDAEVFKEGIKKLIKDNMFIDKEIFNKSENEIKAELEKYYKDVETKTNKLINVLENAGLEKSVLQETANNIKSNLNFMNDLNNMALYMQFPVKFQDSETHGELYVLNRNRHKHKENDVLTAFLHLDMENLGVTDVSIKLEKEQLTTKFSLEDAVSQDIVEEHLHELKKRLEEKGYTATLLIEELNVDTDEEGSALTPFEQVLQIEEPKNFIKRYTLDVRA